MSKKRRGNKDDSKPHKIKKTDCFENDQIFPIEEIFGRLPNLSENIFGRLDNRSLVSCREVSKAWQEYVDSQRVYWIRQISKCNPPQSKFHEEWKIVLEKTPIETLKEFARYVFEYSQETSPIHVAGGLGDVELFKSIKEKTGLNENSEDNRGMTAFNLAASNNHLNLCQVIIEQLQNKNPGDSLHLTTPLHYAALRGHFKICKLIMKSVQDKNPRSIVGYTPLHYAAENGHYDICSLILDLVDDKNPGSCSGWTPVHEAASSGHVDICRLICEKIGSKQVEKGSGLNPGNYRGNTPLHFAARLGHVEVCEFLCLNLEDKNPKNGEGVTPLHFAAKDGQLDVCKLLCSNLKEKNPKDDDKKTPMDLAYVNKQWKIVRFLIDENNLA